MASASEVSGVLLLDKPAGLSSNTALGRVRRLYQGAKAGHTGTLDPFATGLLPIALGEASKFSRFLLDADKGYEAVLTLGVTTTTGDPEGEVVACAAVIVSRQQIREVLARFAGEQQQLPPMFSALKQNGVPLYKLARKGITVERKARMITIKEIALLDWDGADRATIRVACSKGTYIRTLGEDIGKALGCGAYLSALRRTRSGRFDVAAAKTVDEIEALDLAGRKALLLPPDSLAEDLPEVELDEAAARDLGHGKVVEWRTAVLAASEYRVYAPGRRFLGVVQAVTRTAWTTLVPLRLMSGGAMPDVSQPLEFP